MPSVSSCTLCLQLLLLKMKAMRLFNLRHRLGVRSSEVAPELLRALVLTNAEFWASSAGEYGEELRALLLLKLLQSPANATAAAGLPEVQDRLRTVGRRNFVVCHP